MRMLIPVLMLMLAACGNDISPFDFCNADPIDAEVVNRSQFTIDELTLSDDYEESTNLLMAPLMVGESVIVNGFRSTEYVAFVRQRPDQRDDLRITSSSPICVLEGERLVLFDQSFRVEGSEE